MPRLFHPLRYYRPARGVTLVELLTVIAVIAILVGILVPDINLALRKNREMRTKTLFAKVEAAFAAYKVDYGKYPLFPEMPAEKKPWQGNINEVDYSFLLNDNNAFLRQVLMNDASYQSSASTPGAINYNPLKRRYLDLDDNFLSRVTIGSTTASIANPVIVDGFGNPQIAMVLHVGNNKEIDKDSFSKAVFDVDGNGPLAPKIIRNVPRLIALYSLIQVVGDGDQVNSLWVMNFDYSTYNK